MQRTFKDVKFFAEAEADKMVYIRGGIEGRNGKDSNAGLYRNAATKIHIVAFKTQRTEIGIHEISCSGRQYIKTYLC